MQYLPDGALEAPIIYQNGQIISGSSYQEQSLSDRPRGTKSGYVDPASLVPESGRFNPYEYLQSDIYRNNRRGQQQRELDLMALQYIADQRQQEFELNYESPLEDVLRQRQAGLNPDLTGLSGADASGGPSSLGHGVNPQPTNLMSSQSVTSIIENAISSVATIASMAYGMPLDIEAKELSNLQKQLVNEGIRIDNAGKPVRNTRVGLLNEGTEIANAASAHKFGSELGHGMSFVFDKNGNIDWNATYSVPVPSIPLSHSTQKKFDSFIQYGRTHGKGLANAWRTSFDVEKGQMDMAKLRASPYWYPDIGEMTEAFKPLIKAEADLMKKNIDLGLKQNRYQSDLYDSLNAGADGMSGGYINAQSQLYGQLNAQSTAKSMYQMSKPMKQVIDNLSAKAEEGKWWASLMLSSLWVGSMGLQGSQFSHGPKGNSFKIGF